MPILNQVLSGLHEVDIRLNNKLQDACDGIGLSSLQKDANENVIPILSGERINPSYNSLKVESVGQEAVDQLQKIKFIGNCKVTSDGNGNLVIRIGDNLNSSTFNTEDGQTNGTASYSTDPAKTSNVVNGVGAKTNVMKKGSSNIITITTAEKIHLDDAESTTFTLYVDAAGSVTSSVFGPITASGYYVDNETVLNSVPEAATYLQVNNFADEAKTSEGATGKEVNVTFKIDLNKLNAATGEVKFKIETNGTAGAVNYPDNNTYLSACYFISDNATIPSVSDVKAVLPEATGNTQTWSGITSLKSGAVTYKATFEDLNNPATDMSNGASVKFDNNSNFANDIVKSTTIIYSGLISASTPTLAPGTFTNLTNKIVATGWNINGSTSASGSVYESDGTTAVSGLDVYTSTPNTSITTTRVALDGNEFDNAANIGNDDLMIYHGSIQYPISTVTSSFWANESYVQPSTTGDKSALFHFTASGTEKGGTLTINGTGLTNGVVAVILGNSKDNLKDVTSVVAPAIGTNPSSTATKLTYPYTFQSEGDEITSSTGCWVKITLSSTSTAKITSIVRG